jgi:hypothetical protein
MTWQPVAGTRLAVLLASIRRSPIVVRRGAELLLTRGWACVRNTPDVDAYVLAWIASHVHARSRPPRRLI